MKPSTSDERTRPSQGYIRVTRVTAGAYHPALVVKDRYDENPQVMTNGWKHQKYSYFESLSWWASTR